ncbi:TAXI family TRAP transporter solute-binding subunit [Hoeflea sp. CAU 1731]
MKQPFIKRTALFGFAGLLALSLGSATQAETRVTYKSAKSGSSYYQMGVQISEAVKEASDGGIIVTNEESQGSVQNVMEVRGRGADYVFTTPPSLVTLAQQGEGPFEGKGDPKFETIRALFPIPSLTMHFVMSKESGVTDFEQLAGKTLLLGKGSFGAREGARYLKLFGLEGKVKIADVELSNAVPALKNGQIDGFVTAGSYPAPNVTEAAASLPITILSMTGQEIEETGRTQIVIPANTYAGQTQEVITTSLPVVAYTTTEMDDDTAYALTKDYWDSLQHMTNSAPWWNGVNETLMPNMTGKVHPGAAKFYREVGFPTDASLK